MDYFRNTVIKPIDLMICGGIALLLFALTVGAMVMISNSRGKLKVMDAEIAQISQELAQAKQVAAQQEQLAQRIEAVKAQIKDFEARLPTQREIPKLLDSFQEVASLSGIQYQRIEAKAPQEQPLYVKLPFSIRAAGRYPQFGQFLKDLEFGERFIKVESIQMGEEKEGVSRTTLEISTYTFVEDIEEGA